ncbi:polysaccharide deacetylase family protein [Sporosarcina sp. Te-1]|uniref:polysaccharide deacetylase family protein n=1 Tax=Sporosarcina sp. Te-1 TaxID=2818390 RepID=UPI001A9EA165|nr:polysaccharide deacetylase family protein [Sporosarcina sp. Te-1]QTD42982.1 polysaccharide deacetylase family protein [Sporosarcina sp. Te-1]
MRKRTIAFAIASLCIIPLLYSVIATVVIRLTGFGIVKKLNRTGIALTFDDGPHPVFTEKLLDLLKKYNVRATFFVVGEKAKMHPALLKRMHAEGHQIGIHHLQHTSSWRLTPGRLKKQLVETEQIIHDITGVRPFLYRPPWGFMNAATIPLARSRNYRIIIWSHHFKDWKVASCETILLEGLRQVPEDGSIILLHDDGTNPSADDEAPDVMLSKLQIYLEEATAKGIPFILPILN